MWLLCLGRRLLLVTVRVSNNATAHVHVVALFDVVGCKAADWLAFGLH